MKATHGVKYPKLGNYSELKTKAECCSLTCSVSKNSSIGEAVKKSSKLRSASRKFVMNQNNKIEANNNFIGNEQARVLLLSMREIQDLVAYCCLYEFEDVINELDEIDIIKPTNYDRIDFYRKIYKLAKYLTKSTKFAELVTPKNRFIFFK